MCPASHASDLVAAHDFHHEVEVLFGVDGAVLVFLVADCAVGSPLPEGPSCAAGVFFGLFLCEPGFFLFVGECAFGVPSGFFAGL